jgi:ribosomal protein L10
VETAVEEKQIEIARKAITKGFDNETIADLTDLTVEQIEQLRKETKKK